MLAFGGRVMHVANAIFKKACLLFRPVGGNASLSGWRFFPLFFPLLGSFFKVCMLAIDGNSMHFLCGFCPRSLFFLFLMLHVCVTAV